MDGREEARKGTVSVFDGPRPQVLKLADETAEHEAIVAFLAAARADGIARRRSACSCAAAPSSTVPGSSPGGRARAPSSRETPGVPRARALPSAPCPRQGLGVQGGRRARMRRRRAAAPKRIDTVSDEAELEEVYETERHLLYVASTRARDRLLITGVRPGSEFLDDLG